MKKRILSFITIMILAFSLVSCSNSKDDMIEVAHYYIKIIEPVDSKYTQPDNLEFYYDRHGDEEWIGLRYIGSTDEVINIAPEYGGYELKYYYESALNQKNTTTKKIIFPENMRSIDGYVFSNFQNLDEIVLSKTIDNISPITFYNSTIKIITVDKDSEFYETKNNGLYDKKNNYFVHYLDNSEIYEYSVNQATDVLDYAFSNTSLTSIVFGDGVKRISSLALESNEYLTSITLPATFEKIVDSYGFSSSAFTIEDPDTGEHINYTDPRFDDVYTKKQLGLLKKDNPNLKTIYCYADIDYDLSEFGIDFIRMLEE